LQTESKNGTQTENRQVRGTKTGKVDYRQKNRQVSYASRLQAEKQTV
jgi:hypothetical protein